MGFCNVVGGSISRETDCGSYHSCLRHRDWSGFYRACYCASNYFNSYGSDWQRATITNEQFNRLLIELNAIPDKLKTVLGK